MLLIPAPHGNTQILLMTVRSIFYSFVHFSLDSRWLCTLISSLIVYSFSFGGTSHPCPRFLWSVLNCHTKPVTAWVWGQHSCSSAGIRSVGHLGRSPSELPLLATDPFGWLVPPSKAVEIDSRNQIEKIELLADIKQTWRTFGISWTPLTPSSVYMNNQGLAQPEPMYCACSQEVSNLSIEEVTVNFM